MPRHPQLRLLPLALFAFGVLNAASASAQQPPPAPGCPPFGWAEGLVAYQQPNAAFPTEDTKSQPTPDCNFHMWSFEAFVWATALDSARVPRFMTLPTPDDLRSPDANAVAERPRTLRLAARSTVAHDLPGFTEGSGAFVEADGNVMVAQNGYPVYGSVHMNKSYFDTAKQNLIATGAYQQGAANATFPVGAAVFKATWLRLDPGQQAPQGAYTTEAEVPVLTVLRTKTTVAIVPVPGRFVKVTVALVGLHVVGVTVNHPEFLWGTFEHRLNTPSVADNTFAPNGSNPNNFTFYQANVPFSVVNQANTPPVLSFNPGTQRFQPVNNAVLENHTGGENQPNGPGNVLAVSSQGQGFLAGERQPQSLFGNYYLVGTVWMAPGTFNLNSNQSNAVGSVNLANTTAETFVQYPNNSNLQNVVNCFACHNPGSYSFDPSLPTLPNRLVAVSHVLAVGTVYAVPNMIIGPARTLFR
jgi:hypothetical protein